MRTQESGMPPDQIWSSFFEPAWLLDQLRLTSQCGHAVEFGCGYGTFTVAAARRIRGKFYAIDIDESMLAATRSKCEVANLNNVEMLERDFARDGTGLPSESVDYVLLFNILHAEERIALLSEAFRILTLGGKLAVIHWNYDPATPRGPSLSIRPRPNQCRTWAESVGFQTETPGPIDLPPYHYGFVFVKSETEYCKPGDDPIRSQ